MAKAPAKPASDQPAPRKRAPARPKNLAHGRWLGDFPRLTKAEQALIACAARGKVWTPEGWDDKRPEEASSASTIRAGLIRFLLLGGDAHHPVHERGVTIFGGWIADRLDLADLYSPLHLMMVDCHFTKPIVASGARLAGLYLNGSLFPDLDAEGVEVKGGVFLRGVTAQGEVSLSGASIGGQLSCDDATFTHADKDGTATGKALNAQGVEVKGGVFLRGVTAQGEVSLAGALIGGQLSCDDATFTHADKDGKAIGDALNAQSVEVKGGLFFQPKEIVGGVDFTSATIADIADRIDAWPKGAYSLNGLTYKRLHGDLDAGRRIGWLRAQVASQLDENFAPQPWEQLIKVLRDEGHSGAAAQVAIAKQDAMRGARQIEGPLRRPLHWLYGAMAGYGYRPLRIFVAMFCVFLAGAFFFHVGAGYGYMAPTSPLLTSSDLAPKIVEACGHAHESGKIAWTQCPQVPPEYSVFQSAYYSADIILPLVDLKQEVDWSPVVQDADGNPLWFGAFLRWLMWFEILFGWTASLMLVAILGRLVEKD